VSLQTHLWVIGRPRPANPISLSGSLHIRQSDDGILYAWLDRVIASSDRRNGECLRVYSAAVPELDLERPCDTGPPYRYYRSLSGDGHMLTGDWAQYPHG